MVNLVGVLILVFVGGLITYLVIYNWPSSPKVSECNTCGPPKPPPCPNPCEHCGGCRPRCGCSGH